MCTEMMIQYYKRMCTGMKSRQHCSCQCSTTTCQLSCKMCCRRYVKKHVLKHHVLQTSKQHHTAASPPPRIHLLTLHTHPLRIYLLQLCLQLL